MVLRSKIASIPNTKSPFIQEVDYGTEGGCTIQKNKQSETV
jgi:hypothetical protein